MWAIERGSFDVSILSKRDISVVANTSLEECSDVAVLVIHRIKDNDISNTTTMLTSIGVNIVVNFTGSSDQYTCTPHIKLPSGHCLSFSSFNCSTGKVGIADIIMIISVSILLKIILFIAVYNVNKAMTINIFDQFTMGWIICNYGERLTLITMLTYFLTLEQFTFFFGIV